MTRPIPVTRSVPRRRITHMENLCNLDKIVGKRFTFIALPLKIRGGTGSPLRVVAVVYEVKRSPGTSTRF